MTPAWARFTERMEVAVTATLSSATMLRVPEGGADLWRLFCALCSGRQGTGYGPQALSLMEIEAGARLYGMPLEARHVAVLQAMDRAWLRTTAKTNDAAPDGTKTLPAVSKARLTPALFDIVA
ncbi:hypothetical protein [uncultured Jannaschia sp.]|uniref:phage tail assembly chaperone n=1 Tax=uncultured Jannaschia sp. TaxID=293347 RepID=UPI00263A2DAE|nr:hypothetical protein [uncultured Jannaschia sp.]